MAACGKLKNNVEASFIGHKIKELSIRENSQVKMNVQSVFNRVINVELKDSLFSIVSAKVGRAATYCVIPEEIGVNFNNINVKPGSSVLFGNNTVYIEDAIAVDLKKAEVWSGLANAEFVWNISEISLEKFATLKGVLHRYSSENSAYKRMKEDVKFKKAIINLVHISKKERADLAVGSLIGYGPGLTPTGDDLLLGYLSVVNHCIQYSRYKEVLASSIKRKLRNTNNISRNMLSEGITMNYHEFIDDLLYSLVRRDVENVFSSCKKLITIGATSGTDITTGIYLALLYAKDWQEVSS